jgi:surface antigen
MSGILHMDTDQVRAFARQLEQLSERIGSENSDILGRCQNMEWEGPSREQFVAEVAQVGRRLRDLSAEGAELSRKAAREADEWEQTASQLSGGNLGSLASSRFTDISQNGVVLTGAVLGASVVAGGTLDVLPMTGDLATSPMPTTWSGRLDDFSKLPAEIENQKVINAKDHLVDECDAQISSIEKQMEQVRALKSEAEQGRDNTFNKLIPDQFPPAADEDHDGIYRTVSDKYKDIVASSDQQLAQLDALKQTWSDRRTQTEANTLRLQQLVQRQDTLSQTVSTGIPADTPATSKYLQSQLAGCTRYVAEKRNVDSWPNSSGQSGHPGNAGEWDNQARSAGYEVGSLPAKGSIVVFEGNSTIRYEGSTHDSKFESAGHVGYVEKADYDSQRGGFVIEYSQGNPMKDANGSAISGSYTKIADSKLFIPASGLSNVSFIYDKP